MREKSVSPLPRHAGLGGCDQIRGPELAQVHYLAALITVGDCTSEEPGGTTTETYY